MSDHPDYPRCETCLYYDDSGILAPRICKNVVLGQKPPGGEDEDWVFFRPPSPDFGCIHHSTLQEDE